MYGDVQAQHFDEAYLHNPELLDLVQKVKVHVSEEANRRVPEALLSIVEVTTTSGTHYLAEVPYHRGHWKNPMTDDEVAAKFRGLADDLLTPSQANMLLDRLWHLEQVKDIGEVLRLAQI